ncbi:MAG TPA: DUF2254 family protein [Polyangiaceae bacterium]|nr:DUF2254 family protein [Polyangiaceae bacterium]
MLPRRVRKAITEPFWLVLLGALILGGGAGHWAARIEVDEGWEIWGHAWKANAEDARAALTAIFSVQVTVLTIVLSLNAPTLQSAANQYSPRLVPFYLRNAPLRRGVPLFVLSGAYIVAAVQTLGVLVEDEVRPRPVVTGAFLLLLLAFTVLTIDVVRTFRYLRVERVLGLVREATLASVERVRKQFVPFPLGGSVKLSLTPRATPLLATKAGYFVELDVDRLARLARRAGARVRICRTIGEYVDRGELVGWVASDGGRPVDLRSLARTLAIAPNRELDFDPVYGIRILADVASRALSTSGSDPYTARQALQQMRTVLRHLASLPLGDYNVLDPDGTVRVSVMATDLSEFISVAVDSPLRSGASDPEVLDAVLEIALEVGLIARSVHGAEGRAATEALIARVLEDATVYGRLDRDRLSRLHAEADLVRASLEHDTPRSQRHERSIWALTRASELGRSVPASVGREPPSG